MNKKILIGFVNKGNKGAIPTITEAFVDGLGEEYNFHMFSMERRTSVSQGRFNSLNLYYFIVHFIRWTKTILFIKPKIAHFPITSYWNLEKSLLMLFTSKVLIRNITIGHLHGGSFDEFWDQLHPIRKFYSKFLFKSLDHMILLGDYWKNYFENNINVKKLSIVYNPISNNFEDSFLNFNREYSGKSFLFIGSLGERKGIYDLIKVFINENNSAILNLIGPYETILDETKIRRYVTNDSIQICGAKYDEDKIHAYKDNDIFIMPSYNENLPLVILEAACAGMPIITTPVGALPEFFTHLENIYFVQPGNKAELTAAIKYLLNNQNERQRLGENARRLFRDQLSRTKIIDQLSSIYNAQLYV
jgi:glycosyltransferase involved in cell wall biosynthesis